MKLFYLITLSLIMLQSCEKAELSNVFQITVDYVNKDKVKQTWVLLNDTTGLVKPFNEDFKVKTRSADELNEIVAKLNEMEFISWPDRDMPWQNFPQTLRIEVHQDNAVIVKELNDYDSVKFGKLLDLVDVK